MFQLTLDGLSDADHAPVEGRHPEEVAALEMGVETSESALRRE